MNFFSVLRFLEKGNKGLFSYSVEEQRAYLYSLPEPKDDFARSYNQYRCQMYYVPVWKRIFQSGVAAIAYPFLILLLLLKGLSIKFVKKVSAISDFTTMPESIPDEIVTDLAPDSSVWDNALGLKFKDIPFLLKLVIRYFVYPYFVLKVTFKLALYRALFVRYTPDVLVVHNEYSFTSSILTNYCAKQGVEHIDVMHGEKLFYIRDSFFRFSRCYVWDEHYVRLFAELRAAPDQFVVAVPPSLKVNPSDFQNVAAYADVKYYLGLSTEDQFVSIIDSLQPLKESGLIVKFRPHPRYSDMSMLLKYCSPDELEDPKSVTIMDSISNVKYVVGSYSTVLQQAWFAGKQIILDDVTYASTYQKLMSMQYLLSSKSHIKLSEIKQRCEEL